MKLEAFENKVVDAEEQPLGEAEFIGSVNPVPGGIKERAKIVLNACREMVEHENRHIQFKGDKSDDENKVIFYLEDESTGFLDSVVISECTSEDVLQIKKEVFICVLSGTDVENKDMD